MSWFEIIGILAVYGAAAYAILLAAALVVGRTGGFVGGIIAFVIFKLGGIAAIVAGLVIAGILVGTKLAGA